MVSPHEEHWNEACWSTFREALADGQRTHEPHLLEAAAAELGKAVLVAVMSNPEWAQAMMRVFIRGGAGLALCLAPDIVSAIPLLLEVS
jgi:hypothetical protein